MVQKRLIRRTETPTTRRSGWIRPRSRAAALDLLPSPPAVHWAPSNVATRWMQIQGTRRRYDIYIYTRYIYDIDIIVIYTYRFYRTHLQELCGNLDLYETGVIDFLELNGCNCFLLNGLNLVETSCCQPPLDLCQHVTRNNPEFTIYIYTVSIQSLEES